MAIAKINRIVKRKQFNERIIMNLTLWRRPDVAWPFGRGFDLRDELDRLFESPLTGLGRVSESFVTWAPALDVREEADRFVIEAELPGMKKEDLDVSLHDGVLTISGERKVEQKSPDSESHRIERFYGKFQRSLTLPTCVATDKVKAEYKDGILKVTFPKTEQARPKKIDVSVS
jgi:HSP20 family protein